MGAVIIAIGGIVTATGVLVKAIENLQFFRTSIIEKIIQYFFMKV